MFRIVENFGCVWILRKNNNFLSCYTRIHSFTQDDCYKAFIDKCNLPIVKYIELSRTVLFREDLPSEDLLHAYCDCSLIRGTLFPSFWKVLSNFFVYDKSLNLLSQLGFF